MYLLRLRLRQETFPRPVFGVPLSLSRCNPSDWVPPVPVKQLGGNMRRKSESSDADLFNYCLETHYWMMPPLYLVLPNTF